MTTRASKQHIDISLTKGAKSLASLNPPTSLNTSRQVYISPSKPFCMQLSLYQFLDSRIGQILAKDDVPRFKMLDILSNFWLFYLRVTDILGYVWFSESIKERKKNAKENSFFMFGFTIIFFFKIKYD